MKTRTQKLSKERKMIYFVIFLFVLNAFGLIPIGVIGAYTAEPITVTSSKTLEDGTVVDLMGKKHRI
ncbi:MAG: hypothetical protein OEL84_06865 [Nitrosopumilus sp.]|nr:hypothetical protein [Nitrosopumilus sp.]